MSFIEGVVFRFLLIKLGGVSVCIVRSVLAMKIAFLRICPATQAKDQTMAITIAQICQKSLSQLNFVKMSWCTNSKGMALEARSMSKGKKEEDRQSLDAFAGQCQGCRHIPSTLRIDSRLGEHREKRLSVVIEFNAF